MCKGECPITSARWLTYGFGLAELILLLMGTVSFCAAAADTDTELLDAYLNGLVTLSAEVRQTSVSSEDGSRRMSKGNLYVKRPGRFRWEHGFPITQIIVADGDLVWVHDLELEEISHMSQEDALKGTPLQLLVNSEPVERLFKVLPLDSGNNPNSLNLLPKAHDSFIVKIQIEFADERLDTLIMEDDLGNKTWFKFIRTERNPLLKDDLFRVEPPVDRDDDLGGFITH